MGDIKKKRKKFRKPKRPFDKQRINEENALIEKYGLKNKKEIWRAESEISKFRRRAKALISKSEEERKKFFVKLNKIGLDVKEISEVLGLTKEDWLGRRLQTIIFKRKLVKTIKQARQKIIHKNILVNGKIVSAPSFVVTKYLEDKISLKKGKAKPEKEAKEKKVEVKQESDEKDETKEKKVKEKNER